MQKTGDVALRRRAGRSEQIAFSWSAIALDTGSVRALATFLPRPFG